MAKIKNSGDSRCWRGCGEIGTLLHCWWDCKLVQPLWKLVWRFLRKFDIILLDDPAIPLLGIYPEEVPTGYKNTYSTMFIAALFIIFRIWKWSRCPSEFPPFHFSQQWAHGFLYWQIMNHQGNRTSITEDLSWSSLLFAQVSQSVDLTPFPTSWDPAVTGCPRIWEPLSSQAPYQWPMDTWPFILNSREQFPVESGCLGVREF